jgi:hypothetical protein
LKPEYKNSPHSRKEVASIGVNFLIYEENIMNGYREEQRIICFTGWDCDPNCRSEKGGETCSLAMICHNGRDCDPNCWFRGEKPTCPLAYYDQLGESAVGMTTKIDTTPAEPENVTNGEESK